MGAISNSAAGPRPTVKSSSSPAKTPWCKFPSASITEYVKFVDFPLDGDTKIACQAPVLPLSAFTCDKLMLFNCSGTASRAQPRAGGYIFWKACRPVTGSGGVSGTLALSVFGASEHAVSANRSDNANQLGVSFDITSFSPRCIQPTTHPIVG